MIDVDKILNNFDQLDLVLSEGKIISYVDVLTGTELKSFHERLTQPNIAKLYVLKENNDFLYVGTTMQSLTSRIRYGLYANGKNGYHGYKWKHKEKVQLFVWRFAELNKLELESIEAELVFLIRQTTGEWPLSQNEIHFNNEFEKGKMYSEALFSIMNDRSPTDTKTITCMNMECLFIFKPDQWGLRGDPYLWEMLKQSIILENIPKSPDDFLGLLHFHFTRLTGSKPLAGKNYYVEQFAFGGMSSGMVSCDFWLKEGFPLLTSRFNQLLRN